MGEPTIEAEPGISKRTKVAIGTVSFALAVMLPLLRQRGVRSWDTIWAEDGSIYFEQAHHEGGIAVLFRGYGGYLQLPNRVLGALATSVPIDDLALVLSALAAGTCAILAWFTYWASEGWVASRPVRLALASLVVLMPALGYENTGNITNTVWVFAAVAPWAVVSFAEQPRAIFARGAVAFLAATATAVSVIFLPLALGCRFVRRSRGTWIVAATFCAGLALQAAVALNTADTDRAAPVRRLSRLVGLVNVRVFAEYLIGDKGIGALWVDYRRLIIVAAPVCIAAIFALAFRGSGRRNQLLACVFIAYALLSFVVPVWGRGTNRVPVSATEAAGQIAGVYAPALEGVFLPNPTDNEYVSISLRFSVVPVLMLASALAVLIAPARGRAGRAAKVVRVLFVTHIAVLTAIGFSVTNPRSGGPGWSSSLTKTYLAECRNASPDKIVEVQTPTGLFAVALRCGELPH